MPPSGPPSDVQTTVPMGFQALTSERIRQVVTRSGLDPDSEKGHLLAALIERYTADAEFRNEFSTFSNSQAMFGLNLPPDDRLRVLHLLKDLMQGPESDGDALAANGRDFMLMAKALSTRGFKDMLEILELYVSRNVADANDEQYSITELLDAESELESETGVSKSPRGSQRRPASRRRQLREECTINIRAHTASFDGCALQEAIDSASAVPGLQPPKARGH